jgi:hypothetical protein
MVLCAPLLAGQASITASQSHPIGVPVATLIEFGNEYSSQVELYDAKVTVIEVVRGEKAWEAIKQASALNQPPKAGFEYVLARIRFDYSARSAPGSTAYTLAEGQFTAMSADGKEYEPPVLAEQPKPLLDATLHSGDSAEGWAAFLVPRSDARPLMVFREQVDTMLRRGAGSFFQLYYSAASAGRHGPSSKAVTIFPGGESNS